MIKHHEIFTLQVKDVVDDHFDYKVGTDDCSKMKGMYDKCNGPLQPGTAYS